MPFLNRRRLASVIACAYGLVVVAASIESLLEASEQGEGYIPLLLLVDLPLMALAPSALQAVAWPTVPTLCGVMQPVALWWLIAGRPEKPRLFGCVECGYRPTHRTHNCHARLERPVCESRQRLRRPPVIHRRGVRRGRRR